MKLLSLIFLLISLTDIKAQPFEQKLQSAVIKAENNNYLHRHNDAKITSTDIVIYDYRLIPLKDWWKRLYDIHHEFSVEMRSLNKLYDSINGKQQHSSSGSTPIPQNDTTRKYNKKSFDGEAYFKKKYESTDSTIKVYEVYYRVDLKAANDIGYARDSVRICLYPNDLSEVKSF